MTRRSLCGVVRSVLLYPLPRIRPICEWENRTVRLIATAAILFAAMLSGRTFHPAFPKYYFVFIIGIYLVCVTLRILYRPYFHQRHPRPARHLLAVAVGRFRQPWPQLTAAMLLIGLIMPLISTISLSDALFIGQATAILVPLYRWEMANGFHGVR
jgi:hypothetical protein